MSSKIKKQFKNQLALARRRSSLEQKQVSVLLGHKSTEQISRFENGIQVPSLKTALKLALIYGLPLRFLLDEYYKACLREVRKQEKRIRLHQRPATSGSRIAAEDFCAIEARLRSVEPLDTRDLQKAARHSTNLIRLRAAKLDHL